MTKYLRTYLNYFSSEILMIVCNFCELFLLLFIFSYVIFQSFWILVLIFIGIIGIIYNLQDMLVYHPQEPPESKYFIEQPSSYNLPYESVDLVTNDNVHLHTYLLKQPDTQFNVAPTVIMFHGNAGNIGQRLLLAHYFYTVCECNIFQVEYRGYGLSQGVQSEKGFYIDAEAALKHLLSRSDIDVSRIVVYGQSIGGAVAIDLACRFNDKIYAIVVENTFTSLPDIGRELFGGIPGISYLPDFLFKNQYQSKEKLKSITTPALFISGLSDTMIPPRMMKYLYDRCNSHIKRMLEIEEGNHNNTWLMPGYFQFIKKFLQEVHVSKLRSLDNSLQQSNAQTWHVRAS